MNENLVLQRVLNQLGCKEIMSMMNIVNIFTQHSNYLTMLCNNVCKIEPKYCDNGHAHTPQCFCWVSASIKVHKKYSDRGSVMSK